LAPATLAVSWNSEAIRRLVGAVPVISPVLERVIHSVPRHGDIYAAVVRDLAKEPEIAFIGRVTSAKGVHTAVEALALLKSSHGIVARLVVVGPEDQAYGRELRQLAERLGVAEMITWFGPATPDEIAGIFAHAHVLILPSISEEAFPLVTIEGALARVPLVASDVGGTSEGMHDEQHALLFARGSAEGAALALARTLSEDGLTAARVERAHLRAQEFRLTPYLDEQERFVQDARDALSATSPIETSLM
jgi:glycosyltransferase involved in cell wall biosynthesis